MSKTVFFNGRFLDQKVSGTQRYAIEVLKAWDKMDLPFDVTILCPPRTGFHNSFSKIKCVKTGRFNGHLWEQISFPLYVLRKNGIALTISGAPPVFCRGISAIFDATSVRHPESFNWKYRLFYNAIKHITAKKDKGIITDSHFAQSEIETLFKVPSKKICVAYCGTSESIKPDPNKKDMVLKKYGIKREFYLCVGNKAPHKNQIFINKLSNVNKSYDFVIAGGSFKSFGKQETESGDNLIFTGYIPDEDIAVLYENANGFIFPSLYEGFGMPPLEAINYNCKTVFLSDIPVFREVYDREMNFFDPHGDGFELTKGFKTITPSTREYYLNKYTWEKTAKTIADFIAGKTIRP